MHLKRTLTTSLLIASIASIAACGDDDGASSASATTASTTAVVEEAINPCSPDSPPEETALEGDPAGADATIHDIRAVEYRFEDVPDTLPAGAHGFRLIGAGDEFHELALVRVNDTRPIADLLELPEDEQEAAIPYIGGVTACPGETSPDALGAQLEPGRYALICFIPVGTTPELNGEDLLAAYEHAPHFTEGMIAEITVN